MPRKSPVYVPLIPRPRDMAAEDLAAEDGVTVGDAAARLAVSVRAVKYLIADGTLPSVKIGRRRVVLLAGLRAYLAGLIREQRMRERDPCTNC